MKGGNVFHKQWIGKNPNIKWLSIGIGLPNQQSTLKSSKTSKGIVAMNVSLTCSLSPYILVFHMDFQGAIWTCKCHDFWKHFEQHIWFIMLMNIHDTMCFFGLDSNLPYVVRLIISWCYCLHQCDPYLDVALK